MKKVYLPNLSNKFFNNLKLFNETGISIYYGATDNIYRTHANLMPNIYIFESGHISNEILQFILEHVDLDIRFFIYHNKDKINKDSVRYLKKVKHLVHANEKNVPKQDNIIMIPEFLINDSIYYDMQLEKIDRKVYFLDNDDHIPSKIESQLYPNTLEKIVLFNNRNISHAQNLGLLSEYDKAKILNISKYFISDKNQEYVAEASVCGCKIISLENFEIYQPVGLSDPSQLVSYKTFIQTHIL